MRWARRAAMHEARSLSRFCARATALLLPLFAGCTAQEAEPQEPSVRRYSDTDSVRCACCDEQGRMWFGTNHEGVWCLDGGRFTRYSTADGLSSDSVAAITADDVGNLWFATTRGLTRYDGQRFEPVSIPWDGNEDLWGPGLNANQVLCLACDRRGDIWFGTWGNGAHRFDPSRPLGDGRYEFVSVLQDRGASYEGEHRNVVQNIVEDRDGAVWLTSMSHDGVARHVDGRFEHLGLEQGLGDDMVFSACADRAGQMWFGMLGNGDVALARYDGDSFEHFAVADGLGSNNVVSIFAARDGTLWLGSDRSVLSRLSREPSTSGGPSQRTRIEAFTVDGRTFENILFVTEDAAGAVWFGGRRGQLFCYRDGELTDHTQKR